MNDLLLNALKAQNIQVYAIENVYIEGIELYFIKRKLDMRRCRKVSKTTLTIYRDFEENDEKYRGQAAIVIDDSFTEKEIEDRIKQAYYSASFVKNRWYPLPEPDENSVSSNTAETEDWKNWPLLLAEAAYEAETEYAAAEGSDTDSAALPFINSMEIFSSASTKQVLNSNGINETYTVYDLKGEFVAQCTTPQDVETYEDFKYNSLDSQAMKDKVIRVLKRTCDRTRATEAPAGGTFRLILSDKYVPEIMSFFTDRSKAAMIYQHYSNYKTGECVQALGSDEPVGGDLLQITLTATEPFSSEGIPMKDRQLLDDGVLKTIHGSNRFCYYLGCEPTGDYRKISVRSGSVSFEDMKKTPYIHVVNFSDFQMDSMSGNFGGEIRLAYLYDGNSIHCVTGGSVNGSIISAQKHLTLSSESQKTADFEGPLAVSIEGVTIAGA